MALLPADKQSYYYLGAWAIAENVQDTFREFVLGDNDCADIWGTGFVLTVVRSRETVDSWSGALIRSGHDRLALISQDSVLVTFTPEKRWRDQLEEKGMVTIWSLRILPSSSVPMHIAITIWK